MRAVQTGTQNSTVEKNEDATIDYEGTFVGFMNKMLWISWMKITQTLNTALK
jgi:hypothetical protein